MVLETPVTSPPPKDTAANPSPAGHTAAAGQAGLTAMGTLESQGAHDLGNTQPAVPVHPGA